MLTQFLITLSIVLLLLTIYSPARHASHYKYISLANAYNELVFNNIKSQQNLQNCTYKDIILNNHDIDINAIHNRQFYHPPKIGGEYSPIQCFPLIKSAIIVPYRNRSKQLKTFLHFMHGFLQKQNLHYRIFVIEQNDTLPFNRAKMMNYGAKLAIKLKFQCLILHDVDLIPISTGNLYGCTRRPRHMSSSVDIFRYNLPYLSLFGGVTSILYKQFETVNGMSNVFYGWGGEDDDFYRRLEKNDLVPYRFAPEISKYTMLFHKKETPSTERYQKLRDTSRDFINDGLNTLPRNYIVKLEELYTHVLTY